MATTLEQLLTPEEVAGLLQVSHYKVREMLRDRSLKGIKVGGQWRIRPLDLKEYLDRLTQEGDQEDQEGSRLEDKK